MEGSLRLVYVGGHGHMGKGEELKQQGQFRGSSVGDGGMAQVTVMSSAGEKRALFFK